MILRAFSGKVLVDNVEIGLYVIQFLNGLFFRKSNKVIFSFGQ